jgi:hypothetical protein
MFVQLKLKKSLLGAFAMLVLITACEEEVKEKKVEAKKTKTVFTNSCEPNQVWTGEETISKNTVKRSGNCSSKMDKDVEFGMGLRKRSDEISEAPPKKIIAGLWINCPDSLIDAKIVLSVDDEKGNIFWSGFPINKSVKKTNEWVYIENTIDFPLALNPKNYISVYVWNPKKELFYIDDWKIEFSN